MDEFKEHFGIESIIFISVDLNIFVLIESTIFPFWRWRSLMDKPSPMEWRNGLRILKPDEATSIQWVCS